MPKILIVDDDRDLRLGLNARLRASGYETVFAEDGAGAIAAARRESPDLMLLDLGLPAGDGFVVLERMQNLPDVSGLPVIVLSARDAAANKDRAIEAGAVAYFQKPTGNEELLFAIEQHTRSATR